MKVAGLGWDGDLDEIRGRTPVRSWSTALCRLPINADRDAVRKLRAIDATKDQIVVGDLILMEVAMGCRDETISARVLRDLLRFDVVPLASPDIAIDAARYYRALRRIGVTVRTGIDMLIGTFCIRGGRTLVHDDRDFSAMVQYLGLMVL